MNLEIKSEKVFKKLLCIIIALVLLNIVGLISKYYFDHDYVYGLVPLFDLDTEKNIPTFYSAVAILCSSFLLFFIAVTHKKMEIYIWLGLV